MKTIIELKNINKKYKVKKKEISVLENINVSFDEGKLYLIKGHSGAGKSTLINILGLIDKYNSGTYKLDGKEVNSFNNLELSKIRTNYIGFIFQQFYLEENLSALENVCLPMLINPRIKKNERTNRAAELLKIVGLSERLNHKPKQLSGGEQQRVCIARALSNNPKILLCDEPTGNLDEENEQEIFKILRILADRGKCVILVSHSNEAKAYADKVINLNKGGLV